MEETHKRQVLHSLQVPVAYMRDMDASDDQSIVVEEEHPSLDKVHPPKPKEAKLLTFHQSFYEAVRLGKLDKVKTFLESESALLTTRFTQLEANAIQVAVLAGQTDIVRELLQRIKDPKSLKGKNNYGETTLTLAAAKGNIDIADMLVSRCDELVGIKNLSGDLPVVQAAHFGHKKMVHYLYNLSEKYLMNTSKKVKEAQTYEDEGQVYGDSLKVLNVSINAELSGSEKSYNFKLVKEDLNQDSSGHADAQALNLYSSWHDGFRLFKACITTEIYDIASAVFKQDPKRYIKEMQNEKGAALNTLALRDLAEPTGHAYKLVSWIDSYIPAWARGYTPVKHVLSWYDKKYGKRIVARKLLKDICRQLSNLKLPATTMPAVLSYPISTAVSMGNVGFIDVVATECPDMLWFEIHDDKSTFAHAVSVGQDKIYSYLCQKTEIHCLLGTIRPDLRGNTILHYAAMLSSSRQLSHFAGPSLQMQRELQWFKEVEKIAPMCKGVVNSGNKTPRQLFTDQHTNLKEHGETWMKEISTSCSVVATLIVTIMFATAFTVPGGNQSDSGIPIFLESKYFTIFIMSDAFSMFFSCTSALVFLGIHTSLFREEDFLISLPITLIAGLFTLFLSIATMMIAFSAAIVLTMRERFVWIALPILMCASIPVTIYAVLHTRIFIHIMQLTLGRGIFHHPTK